MGNDMELEWPMDDAPRYSRNIVAGPPCRFAVVNKGRDYFAPGMGVAIVHIASGKPWALCAGMEVGTTIAYALDDALPREEEAGKKDA